MDRSKIPHHGCRSLAHLRLQHFLISAQQARATAPEAGELFCVQHLAAVSNEIATKHE